MRVTSFLVLLFALAAIAGAAYWRDPARVLAWWRPGPAAEVSESAPPVQEPKVLKMSPQARQNLGLVAKPARVEAYWRTVLIPGEIVDRPGVSDRGITAPAVGVVVQVHAFPGDTVRAGDPLFTLRLLSEYIQNTQSELFRATREIELVQEQRTRLASAAETGAIPQSRILDLDQQIRRQTAAIQGYRQDLLTRGLQPEQITAVTDGKFASTIEVVAPPAASSTAADAGAPTSPTGDGSGDDAHDYEVQELKADLGQQVQAGQLLGVLANHRSLYITGHAFKGEAPHLEQAAREGWPITVEFSEDDSGHWPPLDQTFRIRHLANAIDSASRTFDFFVPLSNPSRSYEQDGKSFVVWRYRPGQRVRLHVPVERYENVIVLPSGGIVREGPEAYVFLQNGDLFNRTPVRVFHEDRLNVVLANDGSVTPGLYVAQNGAASLNRVLKAQAASGVRADVHVHADGTVHASH